MIAGQLLVSYVRLAGYRMTMENTKARISGSFLRSQ